MIFTAPLLAFVWVGVSGCAGKSITIGGAGGNDATVSNPQAPSDTPVGAGAAGIAGAGPSIAGSGSNIAGSGSNIAGSGSNIAGSGSNIASSGSNIAGSGSGGVKMDYAPCASFTTQAGPPPTKGGACSPTDQQSCNKTCGPLSAGFKSETCFGGIYVEQSGCDFPSTLDASCFKIPLMLDASCPATPPQATARCDVPACTVCNADGNYLDATGAERAGYCVCAEPGASGISKWSCAAVTSWPCPGGQGC